jgi:hypothetical protein
MTSLRRHLHITHQHVESQVHRVDTYHPHSQHRRARQLLLGRVFLIQAQHQIEMYRLQSLEELCRQRWGWFLLGISILFIWRCECVDVYVDSGVKMWKS